MVVKKSFVVYWKDQKKNGNQNELCLPGGTLAGIEPETLTQRDGDENQCRN